MRNSASGKARVRFAVALVGVLVFSVVLVGLSLLPSRAQSTACVVVFKEMTNGRVDSGATLCQTASGRKCTFQVGLDLNSALTGCTPVDLKRKKVHATGTCKRAARVKARGNGMSSVSGTFVGMNVKTKKHGSKAGTCTLKAKAKTGSSRITLTCDPSSSPCATTSTTTTTVVTTTTTIPTGSLSFTSAPGTTDCGGAGLASPPATPLDGEIDSDTAGTTKISDLGLGCLYVGGGGAVAVPPGRVPDGATNFLDVSGPNLVASVGTGPTTCTKGAGPGMHCINDDAMPACTSDTDCAVMPGSQNACQLDANCFFGPPLEFPNPPIPPLSTCVLNVMQMDASGTGDPTTGSSTLSLALSSRVYLTGNLGSPCPHCVSGTCTYGPHEGMPCTTTTSSTTSIDCPPEMGGGAFQAPLPVTLNPFTTGSAPLMAADGNFCPGQRTAGAFGKPDAKRIVVTGSPAGDLTDNMPHPSTLGAAFCIPPTNNPAVDGVADLPGPGVTTIPGMAQLH